MPSDLPLIPCQRALFDIPEDVAYFNCGYMSPLLRSAAVAGQLGIASKSQPWQVRPADFFSLPDQARSGFAGLIGAQPDDIAIVGSASYGIETALKNIRLQAGDQLLICADEFPSNLYPLRRAARLTGADIITVARPDDGDWTQALLQAITPRTRMALLCPCHWTDGGLIDLPAIRQALDVHSGLLLVDATQSLGAMPLDIQQVRPDFLVAATYKWLLGPYSLGFLYVAPAWQDGQPLEENWVNREAAHDFARLVDYREGYGRGARRYDMGERANFVALPMAIAALEQIAAWQVPRIARTLGQCTGAIAAQVASWGLAAAPTHLRAGHFLGLRWPGTLPNDLPDKLAAAQVHVSIRGAAIRITPHVYNNPADVARLLEVLQTALRNA